MSIRLLILPGSARQGSLNTRLAHEAERLAQVAGHSATVMDLRALDLPVYDGDLEAAHGVPDGAARLREAIVAHDALIVVTPEYNGFPTPLFLNAFDWLSRLPATDALPSGLAVTADRACALLAASPGPLGALRSMNALRQYLQMAFAMLVVPQQFALGRANEAFDDAGRLKDAKQAQSVQRVVEAVATLAARLGR